MNGSLTVISHGSQLMKRSFVVLLIASLLLSLAVPLFYGGLGSLQEIKRLSIQDLALLLGLVTLSWSFSSARIQLLCRALGSEINIKHALGIGISREFASTATPAGSGGPAVLILLLTRRDLNTAQATAVLLADSIADLAFFIILMPILLSYYFMTSGGGETGYIALIVVLVMVLGATLLWFAVRHYRPVVLALGRFARPYRRFHKLRFRLARGIIQFRRATVILLKLPWFQLWMILLCSAGYWLARYAVLPVLLWMLHESVPLLYSFLIQPLLMLSSTFVVLPGGGGSVEIGFGLLMKPYLDPTISAFTLLLWRFCTFYWYLIAGAPVFLAYVGRTHLFSKTAQEK